MRHIPKGLAFSYAPAAKVESLHHAIWAVYPEEALTERVYKIESLAETDVHLFI